MPDDDLVRAGSFPNDVEAQLAISVLAESDIRAQIYDNVGSFDLGFGGDDAAVELIVRRADLEQAQQIIDSLESSDADTCPAWKCKCGEEVDEGFFACWSCGESYPGE